MTPPSSHDDHAHAHAMPVRASLLIGRRAVLRSGAVGLGALLLAGCATNRTDSGASTATSALDPTNGDDTTTDATTSEETSVTDPTNTAAGDTAAADTTEVPAGFAAFADTVTAFADGDVWLVESNGMPAHPKMVGITNWQQQVPVPQPYTGTNAWQFPIVPQLAAQPVSARTGLFRGAIALAVNGVPIFNALNNRSEDAYLIGELDEFGGHCGRADDYHYHAAPLHLHDIVGQANPIAYALDGFPIYGLVEPDGSPVAELDEYNGHIGPDGNYHYHGTTTYPYVNGGLVGVVDISDQVEPQPTTDEFRPAGEPLPGAEITAFTETGNSAYRLEYTLDNEAWLIDYVVTDTTVSFQFTNPTGDTTTETYQR